MAATRQSINMISGESPMFQSFPHWFFISRALLWPAQYEIPLALNLCHWRWLRGIWSYWLLQVSDRQFACHRWFLRRCWSSIVCARCFVLFGLGFFFQQMLCWGVYPGFWVLVRYKQGHIIVCESEVRDPPSSVVTRMLYRKAMRRVCYSRLGERVLSYGTSLSLWCSTGHLLLLWIIQKKWDLMLYFLMVDHGAGRQTV